MSQILWVLWHIWETSVYFFVSLQVKLITRIISLLCCLFFNLSSLYLYMLVKLSRNCELLIDILHLDSLKVCQSNVITSPQKWWVRAKQFCINIVMVLKYKTRLLWSKQRKCFFHICPATNIPYLFSDLEIGSLSVDKLHFNNYNAYTISHFVKQSTPNFSWWSEIVPVIGSPTVCVLIRQYCC